MAGSLFEHAARYAESGFRVFPCIPNRKEPACQHGCKDATTDYEQIERWWTENQHYNIGIATTGLWVLDIDGNHNTFLSSVPPDDLLNAPLTRTPRGGRHFWFRQNGTSFRNTSGDLAHYVDTRADGGYVLVPPSVVDGKPYTWAVEIETPENLPPLPAWACKPSRTKTPLAQSEEKIPEGKRNATLYRYACAFRSFGLNSDEIFSALEPLNQFRCVPPISDEEIKTIAASAGRHNPDEAKKSLVLPEQPNIEGIVGQSMGVVVISPDLDELPENDDARETDDVNCFPEDCLLPSGLMGEVISYALSSSLYPQPEICLAGAIALMSVITGRKVRDKLNTRTNLYIVTVNPARSGKDRPREVNKEILYLAGGESMLGPERFGSHAGIISWVEKSPSILFQIDELGRMLATCRDAKTAHLYNIASVLMSLYSSPKSVWIGDAYAETKKTKTIDKPHCVLLGTTTPETLWQNLSFENVADGLIGRLIIFEGRGYVDFNEESSLDQIPESIVQAVQSWIQYMPGSGNLENWNPIPTIVKHSDKALKRYRDHVRTINDRRKSENAFRAAVWSGTGEKTAKLALIHACSRARHVPSQIEPEDVEWAVRVSNWLTRRMLLRCREEVAENDVEARSKKVLRIIGNKRVTMTELTRKLQWLRLRERREIIDDLVGCGLLGIERLEGKTKPATYYFKPKTQFKDRSN